MALNLMMLSQRTNLVSLLVFAMVSCHFCSTHSSTYNEMIERFARSRKIDVNSQNFEAVMNELDKIEGLTNKDIVNAMSRAIDEVNITSSLSISTQCASQILQVIDGIGNKKRWAYQMVDSFGKPGSGLMQFMLEWFGTYDECVDTEVTVNETETHPFETKYCLAARQLGPSAFPITMALGTCFPSSCNETDILIFINAIVYELSPSLTPSVVNCQKKSLDLDQPAIASLTILGIFAFLLIIGTAYDVVCHQTKPDEVDTQTVQGSSSINKSLYSEVPDSAGHLYGQSLQADVSGEDTPLLGSQLSLGTFLDKKSAGVLSKMLLSFSLYTNGKKLLSTKQSSDSLRAVHGIRFLSTTWVILGHTYFFGEAVSMYKNVATALPSLVQRWTFDAVLYATVSVDSFFLLSGLLVAYLGLKEMKKGAGRLNWFMFYFHRYWRLTPPYMFVIMIYVPLFKYWGSGPVYAQNGVDPFCKDNFWLNLLYIQNLVQSDKQCMGWAWYLANDMQFYILSPLIFVPFYFSKWLGAAIAGLFLIATVTTPGVLTSVYDLSDLNLYMDIYYVKPYCRMGPYIIGMLAGYVLYRTNCKIRMNKVLCLIGWVSAAAICLAVLYGQDGTNHGHPETRQVQALYNAMARTAWAVGVAWVAVACGTGNGGFVNTILSWKALIPLSRLTYCAYLVHPVIMFYYFLARRTPFFITDMNMIYCFFGHLMASYLVATVVSLTFESPMMGLEKAIFNRDRRN